MAYPYDDIYSQIMSRFQQQEPYYNFNPYGSGFTGGYDPTLYYRLVGGQAVPGGGTGMNRGSGLLGSDVGAPSSLDPSIQGNYGNAFDPVTGQPTAAVQMLGSLANTLNITSPMQGLMYGSIPAAILGNAAQAMQQQGFSQIAESNSNAGLLAPNDTAGFGSYGENVAPDGGSEAAAVAAADAIANDLSGFQSLEAAVSAEEASNPGSYESSYDPSNPTADYGGDSGGGGGGKIICTKLHELGKMPYHIFKADQDFGAKLVKESPETYDGYVVWARHVVRWMSRDDLIGKGVVAITNAIATPWSVAMAEQMGVDVKSGWFGRFLLKRGLQVCQMIGKMNQRSLQNV